MFRICRAEFKKIFLKPSIFIVTGMLIAILAFSSFLYKPNNRDSSYLLSVPTQINNQPTTVQSFHEQLKSNYQYNTFSAFNTNITKAEELIKEYRENNNVYDTIVEKYNNIVDAYRELRNYYSAYDAEGKINNTNVEIRYTNLKI